MFGFEANYMISYPVLSFTGSITHVQALQISIKFILQVAFDIRKILWKFQNSKPFSL